MNQYKFIILEKLIAENGMKFNFGLNFRQLNGAKWKF